jgi:hypothetical protein
MYTRKSIDTNGVNWIELSCGGCGKAETFGTASTWTDGELTALIERMGWKLNESINTCSRCSRKHVEEL